MQCEINFWKGTQPRDVCANFFGLYRAIVAIQVDAVFIFAPDGGEAGGIDARTQNEMRVARPEILLDEAAQRDGASGFIAVDSRGDVNNAMRIFRAAFVAAKFVAIDGREFFGGPTAGLSRGVEFAQVFGDVDAFAVITTLVKPEALHLRANFFAASASGSGFVLVGKPVFVPARIKTKVAKHLQIFFDRLVKRGEIIADHQRARASHENHALQVAQVHGPAARDHDFLAR